MVSYATYAVNLCFGFGPTFMSSENQMDKKKVLPVQLLENAEDVENQVVELRDE